MAIIQRIKLHDIDTGMLLAQDVIDENGRILMASGALLKKEIIFLLKKHKIDYIWVSSNIHTNYELDTMDSFVNKEIRLKLMKSVESAFSDPLKLPEHIKMITPYMENIVYNLCSSSKLLMYLENIDNANEYLFMHSVNVGLFSILLGRILNLSQRELCILGIGGILHDVGKLSIEKRILEKKQKLTIAEFNIMKQHSSHGYNLLRLESNIDHRVQLIALQHHERINGTGYPWGISGRQIHPLAKIVAVADVYDALTTNRVYRTRLTPFEAISIMMEEINTQFDSCVMDAFQQIVVPYPIGNIVKLNNGLCGKIIKLNTSNLWRPFISTSTGIVNLLTEENIDIVSDIS